jgi:large subunit ribosomal protein L9
VKVIFLEDVPNVARAGDTRAVADGYARNYLIPRKLAVLADSHASSVLEAQMKKIMKRRALQEAEMADQAKKLNGMEITVVARVGEKDRLYGSVTGADIAAELEKAAGLTVDKRKIEIHEPIRHIGTHRVTVRFTHDITADIKVNVEAERVAEEKAEKEEKKPRAKKKAEEAEAEAEEGAEIEAGEGAEAKLEGEAEEPAEEMTEGELVQEELEKRE